LIFAAAVTVAAEFFGALGSPPTAEAKAPVILQMIVAPLLEAAMSQERVAPSVPSPNFIHISLVSSAASGLSGRRSGFQPVAPILWVVSAFLNHMKSRSPDAMEPGRFNVHGSAAVEMFVVARPASTGDAI
jgi:hypothetical protein